mgnify:CR=1 FL=1
MNSTATITGFDLTAGTLMGDVSGGNAGSLSNIDSDFDGIPEGPVGLEDCTKFPSITEELMRRGYPDGDIQKILGLNTMRVMEANIGK